MRKPSHRRTIAASNAVETSAEASSCQCAALHKASRRIPQPYNQALVARGVVDACLLAGSTTGACNQCT